MEGSYDYKKFAILYVDDEENSLKYFIRAFEPSFRILTAPNAADGFRILQEHRDEIGLLMTDQRMPGEQGVQLLERARQLQPRILRVLVTAYSDIDAAINAVNTGAIYKYFTKPWSVPDMEMNLRRGLEFFMVQQERDRLMRDRIASLQNLVIADRLVSLGVLSAGLNHHLRNALVAVRTFVDLAPVMLREENVDFEQLRNPQFWTRFYENAQAQIARITDMLRELRLVTQKPSLPFTHEAKVAEVVARVLEELGPRLQERKISVQLDLPESLPLLTVDQWKFNRLFELLFTIETVNLAEGGQICLTGRSFPSGDQGDLVVEIELRDNSAGLPLEGLRAVFDPLAPAASQSLDYGINLMTCYFIVYHHGGKVEVKSDPGQGVTMRMSFPTNYRAPVGGSDDEAFLAKVLANELLWEKLLAGR